MSLTDDGSERARTTVSTGTRRDRAIEALVLVLLGAFAVTQPILSDFRAGAGYFLARNATPLEIVVLVLLLTFLPGLLANLFVWAADAFSERARRAILTTFVGVFVTLIAQTTLLRLVEVDWRLAFAASIVCGVIGGLAYKRSELFKTFLTYLIPAPLVFVILFLFTPPVSALILPSRTTPVSVSFSTRTPVVIVIFDELPVTSLLNRQGSIDAERLPNFARLASMATWYQFTVAAHDYTWWAVPPVVTGITSETSRLPTAMNYPGNVFSLLAKSHELNVVEPFTRLCPAELCEDARALSTRQERLQTMARDTLRLYDMMLRPDASRTASFSDPFNEFGAGAAALFEGASVDRLEPFRTFLRQIGPGAGLHFAHLLVPHAPFSYYPSGLQYNNGGEIDGLESGVWVDPVLASQGYQRHLLQVEAMDQLVGELIERLEGVGVLDEALVVVVADHGASFRPDVHNRNISEENAYDIAMVPLFIKAPMQREGRLDSLPARTIDVLPTIASHLGVDLPWRVDGRSLVSDRVEDPTPQVIARYGSPIPINDPVRGVGEGIEYMLSLFGTGGSIDAYSLGSYDSLLGTLPIEVLSGQSQLSARVAETWRFVHVAPELGFVPGFVQGELIGDVDARTHVAVALNGVIRAVVPAFDIRSGRARFSAILPDEAFVAGFNRVAVYVVTGPSDDPLIRSIEQPEQREFRLLRGPDGSVISIADSTGASWNVVDEPIRGSIDQAYWTPSSFDRSSLKDLHVVGWAIDEAAREPAEQVVLFVNGVFAGVAELDRERSDMVDAYDLEEVRFSGFHGIVSQFLPGPSLVVDAYALSGDTAAELEITDAALDDIASGPGG